MKQNNVFFISKVKVAYDVILQAKKVSVYV